MNKKPPPTNSSKTDLYDKINVDSKLKEHLYSPLMFEGQLVSGKHTTTKLAEAIKNAKSGVIRTVTTATAATLTSAVIINQQHQQNMQKQKEQVGKIAASEEYNYAMSQKSIKQWPSTSKSGTGGDEYDEYNDEEEDEEDEEDDEEEEEENYDYEDEDEEEEEEDEESHKKKEACAKKCECSSKVLY